MRKSEILRILQDVEIGVTSSDLALESIVEALKPIRRNLMIETISKLFSLLANSAFAIIGIWFVIQLMF